MCGGCLCVGVWVWWGGGVCVWGVCGGGGVCVCVFSFRRMGRGEFAEEVISYLEYFPQQYNLVHEQNKSHH